MTSMATKGAKHRPTSLLKRKMAVDMDARSLTLRVNPEIAKTLKTRESSLIEELEQTTRKSVIIQSDPTLHWEQYDIY